MEMKIIKMFVLLLLFSSNLFGDGIQPEGIGTSGDPFQVNSLDNLLWLSTNSSSWGNHFIQTANIDASDTQNWNSGAGFSPIGTGTQNSFNGVFDGGDYEITNLYINRLDLSYQGLFGVAQNSVIKNIVISATITARSRVGSLIGFCSATQVLNCVSNSTIHGDYDTGNLIGRTDNNSTIYRCSSQSSTTIVNSWGVAFYHGGGGMIGRSFDSTIQECFSTRNLSSRTWSGGGLIGTIDNTIVENCYSTVNCHGPGSNNTSLGGLIGIIVAEDSEQSIISNCYSKGLISYGLTEGYLGGLIGKKFSSSPDIQSSYWDTETSNQSSSDGGLGKKHDRNESSSYFYRCKLEFYSQFR